MTHVLLESSGALPDALFFAEEEGAEQAKNFSRGADRFSGDDMASERRFPQRPPLAAGAERQVENPGPAFTPLARRERAGAADSEMRSSPDLWPEEWRTLLARTRPAPLVWSYAELGEDLMGAGNKERSESLRKLIGSLQLPRGSSAFWPLRLPEKRADSQSSPMREQGRTPPQAKIFLEGLALLEPKALVLIGPSAVPMTGLSLKLSTPFTQTVLRGRLIVLLPDFFVLINKPTLMDKAGIFLRSALSGLPGIFQA